MELSPKNPAVSIVIPVYGGESTIEALVEGLRGSLEAADLTFEVLLICDRPRDGSWAIASRLASSDRRVAAVLLGRNYGQHPATLLGMRMAQGTTIVTMDEDLQHSPEEVPRLVAASRASGGIVYGVASRLQHGVWRNFTSRTAPQTCRPSAPFQLGCAMHSSGTRGAMWPSTCCSAGLALRPPP